MIKMEKNKRIILVTIGIGLIIVASILLIMSTKKRIYENYVNSLDESEITEISLNKGDILIIKTEKLEDTISIIKILDENGEIIASSQSELGESVSLIYTAEESGKYTIVAKLDNPENEIDGVITITVQNYTMIYIILFGILFIFAAMVTISASLLREQWIIPATTIKEKKKFGALIPEELAKTVEKRVSEPSVSMKGDVIKKYKSLIQPLDKDMMKNFIGRIYYGIKERKDIIGGYAIDLKSDKIIWRLSDQKGKAEIELLKNPVDLKNNKGIYALFNKIIDLYSGILPPEIILSFPNYILNGLVHKQICVLILLKPEVGWGISGTIFKKG